MFIGTTAKEMCFSALGASTLTMRIGWPQLISRQEKMTRKYSFLRRRKELRLSCWRGSPPVWKPTWGLFRAGLQIPATVNRRAKRLKQSCVEQGKSWARSVNNTFYYILGNSNVYEC